MLYYVILVLMTTLYAAIGSDWGTASDSAHFRIPDLRESVLVGVGQNSTYTIQHHDVYAVGEFKDDQFQGHKHNFTAQIKSGGSDEGSTGSVGTHTSSTTVAVSDGTNGTPRTGATTHGKQLGSNYIVKY